MGDFLVETWEPLCEFLGSIIRPLGGLVAGIAIGWIAVSILLDAAREWQLKIAVFLGLVGALICMHIYSGVATTGVFALGIGVGTLILAIRQGQSGKKKEK